MKQLWGPPGEVVSFLEALGPGVRAVYEAGPTRFGLVRAARERGIELQVVAPGSIPKGPTDRVKTDRRDAARLARLLAAGELRFAYVRSVADEQFRDLTRSLEDVRGDLMRARHRLGKFLLRRGERYGGPGGAWTSKHMNDRSTKRRVRSLRASVTFDWTSSDGSPRKARSSASVVISGIPGV